MAEALKRHHVRRRQVTANGQLNGKNGARNEFDSFPGTQFRAPESIGKAGIRVEPLDNGNEEDAKQRESSLGCFAPPNTRHPSTTPCRGNVSASNTPARPPPPYFIAQNHAPRYSSPRPRAIPSPELVIDVHRLMPRAAAPAPLLRAAPSLGGGGSSSAKARGRRESDRREGGRRREGGWAGRGRKGEEGRGGPEKKRRRDRQEGRGGAGRKKGKEGIGGIRGRRRRRERERRGGDVCRGRECAVNSVLCGLLEARACVGGVGCTQRRKKREADRRGGCKEDAVTAQRPLCALCANPARDVARDCGDGRARGGRGRSRVGPRSWRALPRSHRLAHDVALERRRGGSGYGTGGMSSLSICVRACEEAAKRHVEGVEGLREDDEVHLVEAKKGPLAVKPQKNAEQDSQCAGRVGRETLTARQVWCRMRGWSLSDARAEGEDVDTARVKQKELSFKYRAHCEEFWPLGSWTVEAGCPGTAEPESEVAGGEHVVENKAQ
ncbi:hypothetical protein DFH06DRAFT_1145896 [Mycena polygramma]|nr:hypothetical protein DFH06DRAFT_1145896 [Mycena polygramma]